MIRFVAFLEDGGWGGFLWFGLHNMGNTIPYRGMLLPYLSIKKSILHITKHMVYVTDYNLLGKKSQNIIAEI